MTQVCVNRLCLGIIESDSAMAHQLVSYLFFNPTSSFTYSAMDCSWLCRGGLGSPAEI